MLVLFFCVQWYDNNKKVKMFFYEDKMRFNQQGRSMIEIIAVLAIIGILSVGGIAGYSKAMAKHKLTKSQDQIQLLTVNIRSAFAGSANYENLDNISAVKMNVVPAEMLPGTEVKKETGIVNTFGGDVIIKAKDGNKQRFQIKFKGIGAVTCTSLASSDWGTEGLVGIIISNNITDHEFLQSALPIKATEAMKYCDGPNDQNSITWEFY